MFSWLERFRGGKQRKSRNSPKKGSDETYLILSSGEYPESRYTQEDGQNARIFRDLLKTAPDRIAKYKFGESNVGSIWSETLSRYSADDIQDRDGRSLYYRNESGGSHSVENAGYKELRDYCDQNGYLCKIVGINTLPTYSGGRNSQYIAKIYFEKNTEKLPRTNARSHSTPRTLGGRLAEEYSGVRGRAEAKYEQGRQASERRDRLKIAHEKDENLGQVSSDLFKFLDEIPEQLRKIAAEDQERNIRGKVRQIFAKDAATKGKIMRSLRGYQEIEKYCALNNLTVRLGSTHRNSHFIGAPGTRQSYNSSWEELYIEVGF